jgi:RNA polymerase sigma-70 factor (ECF subfamily)
MDETLAGRFEEHRPHLQAVARRMLGSGTEAEDAVQEGWLRLQRSDTRDVGNLGGWLTTVVARVCLDMLRSRQARRERPLDEAPPVAGVAAPPRPGGDPEQEAVLSDAVGTALLVVLDTLTPPERLAFVLHDLFGVPFEEIAPIVDRSPAAARQLASRARRRVQGAGPDGSADLARRRRVVSAFLTASRDGDFAALLSLLDPDVVVRADPAAAAMGADAEVRGAEAVARTFLGRARAARPALADGEAALVWAAGGRARMVFHFQVVDGRITGIEMVADEEYLDDLEVEYLDRG